MTLNEIDKSELILESYRIEGITASECRSLFLDWALKLPSGFEQKPAIDLLIQTYTLDAPDHPMGAILTQALLGSAQTGRRGGRAARHSG